MADQADGRVLVLNNLLCFVLNKYDILDEKCLKSLISSFYTNSDIGNAKKILLKFVQQVKFDRPFTRYPDRQGTNRADKEIDDIVDIVRELDERASIDSLPRFVTDETDKVPSPQFNEGDVRFLLNKMDKMEATIQSLQSTVYTLLARLDQKSIGSSQSVINVTRPVSHSAKHHQPRSVAGTVQPSQLGKTTTTNTNVNKSWAAVVDEEQGQATSHQSNVSEVDMSDNDNQDGVFTLYESPRTIRKKRRLHERSPGNNQSNENVNNNKISTQSAGKIPNKPLLVGKRSTHADPNNVAGLASAGPWKAVFCISNVSQSTTDVQLKKFVEDLGVRVVSCYQVKPRLSQWQRERKLQPNHNTFRLYINRLDIEKLLVAESWPEDVSVSKWFFKKQTEKSDEASTDATVDKHLAPGDLSKDMAVDNLTSDLDSTILASDPRYSQDTGSSTH